MRYILLLLFLKLSTMVFSQDRPTNYQFINTPLSEVLAKIESGFDVRFSYKNELGGKYKINRDFKNTRLNDILTQLSEELPINFQRINKRYIAVKEKDQSVTINGCLVDKNTQEPLMAGTIVNVSQVRGCSSNQEGQFNLKNNLPGDTISISYIGYRTHNFPVKNGNASHPVKIEMEETHQQLNEVLIDYTTNGIRKKEDGAMVLSSFDLKSLSNSANSDYFGGLQQLPGINSPTESNADFNIRGGTPDHNLILWNGITVYQNSHFFGMISVFNPNQISGLKVYRGEAGAEYGNRISGVIDMRSDRRIPEKIGGSASINCNFLEGLLRVPVKKERVGFTVSARRSYGDLFSTPTFEQYYERAFQNTIISENEKSETSTTSSDTDYYFEDLALNSTFKLSDNSSLYFNYLYSKNSLKHQFSFGDIQENEYRLRIENHGLSLMSETRIADNAKYIIKADYTSYDLYYRGYIQSDKLDEKLKDNTIYKFGLEMALHYKFNANNKFKVGFQLYEPRVSYRCDEKSESNIEPFVFIQYEANGEIEIHSFFSEYQWNWKKIFYLNFGLRAGYYKFRERTDWEPRLFAKLLLDKSFHLKMSAGYKNQFVSQILEFGSTDFGLETQVWARLEQAFPALRSTQLMAGMEWKQGKYSLDVESYYRKTSGLNSFSKAFQNRESKFSHGSSKTYGLDVHLKRQGRFSNNQLSYSFQDTDFDFPDIGDPFPGNFEIKHAVSASSNWFWKNFQFSLIWNWHTGKPYTPALGLNETSEATEINYGKINSSRLSNYHRLDFNSSYQFSISNQKKMSIGFSVLNVYDHKSLLDRSYRIIHGDQDKLQELDNYSLGITPNVFLRIDF